jgi:hypothetical protein
VPLQIPTPEKPQFGVGKFETHNVFNGLAGLRFAYQSSLGWFFPRLGIKLGQVPGATSGDTGLDPAATAALFASGTEAILEQMGHGMTATQSVAADAHVTHAAAMQGLAAGVAMGASDTLNLKKHVARVTAPKVITRYVKPNVKAIVAPYAKRTAEAEARARHAEATTAKLEQRVAALERKMGRTSAIALPGIEGRLGDVERWVGGAKGELKRLGKLATVGGILALIAEVLKKMGANWMRCSNSKRYGKTICGMNPSFLEGLIADALLVVSAVSLVEFAKELIAIETEVVKGIEFGVKELKPGFKPVAGKLH